KLALAQLKDWQCGCCGNPTFEFYRDGQLIATIGLHHGNRIRWPDVWPTDAELPRETKSFIRKWLADNNLDLDQIDRDTPLD
ncbi:MAG: hypothetical protein ACYTE5_12090, partial [Planctomycetota bacterium]